MEHEEKAENLFAVPKVVLKLHRVAREAFVEEMLKFVSSTSLALGYSKTKLRNTDSYENYIKDKARYAFLRLEMAAKYIPSSLSARNKELHIFT